MDLIVHRLISYAFAPTTLALNPVWFLVSQSSFDELQTERNEYMLEEWRFGFNVVYDFPAIFCERCDNLVEKCSNLMNESRYPVCKPDQEKRDSSRDRGKNKVYEE